ncbi:Protein asteroid-like 1 [Holothuria leucospilota]|uniref:Protein asteroid-like 1 n=1 Tax=Holothuria leucospilota TaxID=206669 RepID=A0A9Q1H6Y2_HOLLE|nr:Protein asteroid-like 1 [Holothuria leucospilota]
MGVRGLTTFINQHQQFFENYSLHSTSLVVDGYGLMSQFYFDHSIDPGNHGGQYQAFYNHCAHFFENLSSCGVKCFVVFDGGYDMDGKKFETMKERCQQKINNVKTIVNGGHACIMPIMASDVLKKVLRDFEVPFLFSDFEADRDIAVLANDLQGPVLGQDSDFFVMNIQQGYIPFDRLQWRKPCQFANKQKAGGKFPNQKKQSFLHCQRYKIKRFCDYFQVELTVMPLFASLSGNDYLQAISLGGFYGAIKQRHQKPDNRQHPRRKGNYKFCELLYHLTYFETFEECLEEVVKHVPVPERSKVRTSLESSCSMYKVTSPSSVTNSFVKGDLDLSENALVRDHGLPIAFVKLLQQGLVPTMCLNILLNRMYFVGTQVEKLSQIRSSACCDYLFRILCGIMLVDIAKEFHGRNATLTIDIFDRDGYVVKCNKVVPICELRDYGTIPSFRSIFSLPEMQRRSLLLTSLNANNINISNVPPCFQLVLLLTVYCFRNAKPPLSWKHLCSLVLGWIQGLAWCKRNTQRIPRKPNHKMHSFDSSFNWEGYEVTAVLQNFDPLMRRSFNRHLDLDASHGFAQWIACARIAHYLNAVLLEIFPRADMTVLFNGLLLHNIYFKLCDIHPAVHQEWIQNTLLKNVPSASHLFNELMTFFSHHLGFQQWEQSPLQPTRGIPRDGPHHHPHGSGQRVSHLVDRNRSRGGRRRHGRRGGRNQGQVPKSIAANFNSM